MLNGKNGIIVLLCFLLLTGCSHIVKDGPPRYDVDVSRIPDAKPKVEPLSRIGNKPYQVFGKRYYVMGSSKNYKERGIASWYGSKFHSRNTSNGERYDMLAMTAAHRSLPLPTYVQVKNLNNGKQVIVKVNDRGPFESSRLIDLSYAAAKKLGIVAHGTARVEVTAIDPRQYNDKTYRAPVFVAQNTPRKTIDKKQRDRAAIYLQVGTFSKKSYAEKLQKQLRSVIHSPVHIAEFYKSKMLYRVQIGPLKDQASVYEINEQLNALGLQASVYKVGQPLHSLELNGKVLT